MVKHRIVTECGRMWPRAVFDIFDGNALALKSLDSLQKPGVYILYRDDTPYYIGKATNRLFSRLHSHANVAADQYFNFWNYFSFFVVPERDHVAEVEGILIASTPSANIAAPRIRQVRLPNRVAKVLREARRRLVSLES